MQSIEMHVVSRGRRKQGLPESAGGDFCREYREDQVAKVARVCIEHGASE